MTTSLRRIAHLDMDAFYASVELLRYPELRGLPLVIGGGSASQPSVAPNGTRLYSRLRDYVGRGVITTASYEARTFGVHSAMGLMKAARLAPDAILLPADFNQYRLYSRRFKEAVASIAPRIEDRGIDEIYIDLTDHAEEGLPLARTLKTAVRDATGLGCSIGIAANKLLAKIASDLDKPDGITVLGGNDLETRIWPLPAGRINGIGPKAQERLAQLGIRTIGELANTPMAALAERFSRRYAHWLLEAAHGRDDRPVIVASVPKSISRETTFERDLHLRRDRETLEQVLDDLCARVERDLARKGLVGRTVGVKLRYDDFRIVTREQTLAQPVGEARWLRQAAAMCLERIAAERRIRLLGVRVGTLSDSGQGENTPGGAEEGQLSLFL